MQEDESTATGGVSGGETASAAARGHGADDDDGGGGAVTARGLERTDEDERYVPVILKRTDEARRHPDDTLQAAIREGLEQLHRRAPSLVLSAVAAGLILCFTAMAVAVAHTVAGAVDAPLAARLATALVYPFGFVVCIMSGTELFTEHTATAVYPVLDRRAGVGRLLRLWALVLAGNLVGALAGASLLAAAADVIDARAGVIAAGRHFVDAPVLALLVSATLAGWLMALGAWLILSTPPEFAQIASIYIVTFLIGLGGLHHSIAGGAEVFAALLVSDAITVAEAGRALGLAVAGNLIGGSFFVAVLNYAHIRQSRAVGAGDAAR